MKRSLAILALGLGLVVLAPLRAELTPVADKRPDVRGPAGAYSVNVPRPASITYGDSWILIDWSSPGPGPSPAPAPLPTPLPVPVPTPPAPTPPIPPAPAPAPKPVATGKLFATLITDQQVTDDLAVFKGVMMTAGKALKALDVAWHVYVVGQAELKTLNLAEHIPPAGPPIVIVQELKPGETVAPVIATVKPTTAEALLEDLAKLRGK